MFGHKKLDALVQAHRAWLADSGLALITNTKEWANQDLNDGSLHSFGPIATALEQFATYYGINGSLSVIDGDQKGWQEVHRSVLYNMWAIRLNEIAFRRLPDEPSP